MPLAKNMISAGFSAAQAQALNGRSINSAVAAAGTTQGTATALTADLSIVTSGGADAGVQLYSGVIGDSMEVFNNQLVNTKVYPPTSGTINQIAANGAHTLGAQTSAIYKKVTSTAWVAYMSA